MRDYSQAHLTSELVYKTARKHPSRPAVLYGDDTLSYPALATAVARSRAYFSRLGITPGDRVLILLPDCPSFLVAFFGAMAAGGIPTPLSNSVDLEEAASAVTLTRPRVIVVEKTEALRLAPLRLMLGVEKVISASALDPDEFEWDAGTYEPDESIAYAPDGMAYGLFSSGSTGMPKLIPHRHQDLLLAYDNYAAPHVAYRAADVCLSVAKLHFGYGLGNNMAFPFRAGAAIILLPMLPEAVTLISVARTHQPTLFFSQPRALAALLSAGGVKDAFGSVRLCVSAGEPLHGSLADKWRAVTGKEVHDSYGTTEVGHVFLVPGEGHSAPGTVGTPIAGCEVELRDADGAPIHNGGRMGELWVRIPSAASHYWNNRAATAETFQGGWVRTRDIFFRDTDGRYYPRGRVDDMVKLGCGKWVNPIDVEEILSSVPGVVDCVVVGSPGSDGLTVLKAILVTDGGGDLGHTAETVAKRVRERWPEEPERWLTMVQFASGLPKTPTGKIKRSAVEKQTMTEFAYNC